MDNLLTTPVQIARLPKNHAGYPVPWFAAKDSNGDPDFRLVKPGGVAAALAMRICWICGTLFLPRENRVFTVGPMCALNRISAEPPSHYPCAVYAATHCPFLVRPDMRRRDTGIPEDARYAGTAITRNPGVALVWVTRFDGWSAFPDGKGNRLFNVGEPRLVRWFAKGKPASRAQVVAAIDSGLPELARHARAQGGRRALDELDARHRTALELAPAS